jgi:hypothetical protein
MKKARAYIHPDVILQALINPSESVEKIIGPDKVTPIVSDFALYEALMCVEPDDDFNVQNLIMLMRNSEFLFSGQGMNMTAERRKHLRKTALGVLLHEKKTG